MKMWLFKINKNLGKQSQNKLSFGKHLNLVKVKGAN